MKKIVLGLSIIFSMTLVARENPFAKYEEETGMMYDLNETPKTLEEIQEAEYIKKVQEQMNGQNKTTQTKDSTTPTKPAEKTYSKKELDTIIQKTNKQNEQKTKEIVKKELANVKKEPEQVIYVKPRADIESEKTTSSTPTQAKSKTILPFLKIDSSDGELIIKSDHSVFKKFSINKENKLAFDFKAKVSFNSKKEPLLSNGFKNIAVGNHQNAGYYRVAVELSNKPSQYSVDVDNGTITIKLK